MDRSTNLRRGQRASFSLLLPALLTALMALASGALGTTPASADGPGKGTPWIVTLGDSYISGEAGRWAGNTNKTYTEVDALGSTAYYDNSGHTAELIAGCHRSQSAEVYTGITGVNGENLACSGAETSSYTVQGVFKPGLDFYNSGGHEGQALMLEKFAEIHNVVLVPISIGGNNFEFARIVETCVTNFVAKGKLCSQEPWVIKTFEAANVATQQAKIKEAVENVVKAMEKVGYNAKEFAILIQDYPSPIPSGGSGFRYPQTSPERQSIGGCGFWDTDATEANSLMLPTINTAELKGAEEAKYPNFAKMEISLAFNGHRLCEKGVGLLEQEGLLSWKETEAVNKSEWFSMIRTPLFAPFTSAQYLIQEDLHPDYWAQLALRNCLTQAYHSGEPIGGTCAISGPGLNSKGEPNMLLK
jgi:hypothetical protein